MGRKSSSKPTPELPGCFNGMWNAAADAEETPVLARKSLSERKFSEGFEAPRNSLDIASAIFERHNAAVAVAASSNDEIPFGFEFAVEAAAAAPMRITVPNGAASMGQDSSNSSRCRSPSVIARLMGLDTLPAEQQSAKQQQQQQSSTNKTSDLQAWRVMSERRELLSSRSSREHRTQEKPLISRQLSSSRLRDWPLKMSSEVQPEDELLLFDVLPFRDHPQEKQLEKLKHKFEAQRQLEEQQLKKQQLQVQRSSKSNCNSSIPIAAEKLLEVATTKRNPESREMLDAIQFLQSNKEFLVKFLREPNSVFAKHIYDLQALAAKEVDAEAARTPSFKSVINKAPREIVAQIHHHHHHQQQQQQQDNIGFSRKLVETKKDLTRSNNTNKKEVVQKQRKDNAHDKIVLLKPNNVKKQSSSLSGSNTPTSRTKSAGDFRSLKDVDPKELARQIARQARENVSKELDSKNSSSCSWSGQMTNEVDVGRVEGSEPSSRRYTKDFQVSTSLPNSPKLSSKSKSNVCSKEGRKQLMEKLKSTQSSEDLSKELFIQIELEKQQQQESLAEPKKAKGGKLLKLFSRDSSPQKVASSDKSPRLLVRSKSVPSIVEEKNQGPAVQALDRTHSCKQTPPCESSKGKFSSLKSSLLGKKKGHHQRQHSRAAASDGGSPTSSSSGKSQSSECREIEHSVVYEDHYTRTFRETEAQLASTYGGGCNSGNKFSFDAQSPRFLSVDISESPDASSEIHRDKSEQPSPVSVLERGFIEESPSPVSFEDVSSDLQELQVRLERLKLDESGRSYDAIPAESGFDIIRSRQGDLDASPSSRSSHCSPASQDQHYISKLIHESGLSDSLGSLFTWHTPSCPIDPYLFAKMEEDYSGSEAPSIWPKNSGVIKRHRKLKIGRSFNAQVQRRPETLHRQMIFDVVNEVLAKKFQHLWNEQPWQEIGKQGIKAVPSGKHFLLEVGKEMEVFRHDYDSCEYPLENLVERDVNRGGQWMDTRDELRKITSQVEAGIFNSLVEELAMSFIR